MEKSLTYISHVSYLKDEYKQIRTRFDDAERNIPSEAFLFYKMDLTENIIEYSK